MAAYISFQPRDNYKTHLYTGTGSSNAQTFPETTAMQPDFTWIKNRDAADFHVLTDSVRGATKYLMSDANTASTTNAESLKSFDSDGFTVGTMNEVNTNTEDFVSWNWKAGTTTGIAGSPSITPASYSFNATSGFSIIKWTGTGANATLPHGLGVAPKFIIVKNLDGLSRSWRVYHSSLGATKYLYLAETNAAATDSTIWNDTEPTTTLFSVGTNNETNESGDDLIAYCFADIKGYSKFGGYTGNGNADGPFIYTGFRPAFVIIKVTSAISSWSMVDTKRDTYNPTNKRLFPNKTNTENTSLDPFVDLVSNGFKLKTSSGAFNASSGSYIYMAFAEFPLVASNGIPTIAR